MDQPLPLKKFVPRGGTPDDFARACRPYNDDVANVKCDAEGFEDVCGLWRGEKYIWCSTIDDWAFCECFWDGKLILINERFLTFPHKKR